MPKFRVRITKTDVIELDVVVPDQKDAHRYAQDGANVSNQIHDDTRNMTLTEIILKYKDDA